MPKKDYTVRVASLGPQSQIRILLDYDRFFWAHTAQMQKKTIQSEKLHWAHKAQEEYFVIMMLVYLGPHRPDAKKDFTFQEASLGQQSQI